MSLRSIDVAVKLTVACGIGYDAEVMDKTTPPQKLRWGKLAYLANAVGQADELRAVKHVLTIDGTRDRKSTRLNSSHSLTSRMPSSA